MGPPGRRPYTEAERQAFLAAFDESGLAVAEFCELNEPSESALYRWLAQRAGRTPHSRASFGTTPITATGEPTVSTRAGDPELLQELTDARRARDMYRDDRDALLRVMKILLSQEGDR